MEEKIIELIATHLEKGDYKIVMAIIFTSVVVAIIWKFKSFLEYWSYRQNFRRSFLEEIIVNTEHNPKINKFLQNELIREYFTRAFKFNSEIYFIEKLVDFHIFLNGEFTFNQIIKSSNYIKFEDGILSIKLKKTDWFFQAFLYYVLAVFLVLYGAILLLLSLLHIQFFSLGISWENFSSLIFSFVFIFLGAFVRIQAVPYENAKKLKSKLEVFNGQRKPNIAKTDSFNDC